MTTAFFVTGTDTGAGKTFTSTVLLHALRQRGLRAVGMKPVASGSESTPEGLRNEDALALQAASEPRPDYALVNPWALREPTAPEIAARLDGVEVTMPPISAAFTRLQAMADVVLVEGVGGFLAPVNAQLDQCELPRALRLPVLVVVGLKLGCINHARMTVESVLSRGFPVLGWIASDVEPTMLFPDDYFEALKAALPVPCLGRLPHAPGVDPATLTRHLQLPEGFPQPS
ncbi:dethiobiotin synthase [Silanimonas sp.]|uniref:dethiobiotin synthase n=1 Tax=Silanimonas sp. TaxID=1929290 RepID=UPI0022BE6565|nr:dethiobiotin synthase [Silanimonas sp.]MCZ8064027.1 dethiobiotin synthase [Silanimonas sp.]